MISLSGLALKVLVSNVNNTAMEHYFNNFLFTYFPHISITVFWFGLITRIVMVNKSIKATSTQLLTDKNIRLGSNMFHIGIIAVFLGHFTLFIPEELYHLFMTTETKRIVALSLGSFFGLMAFAGMLILAVRRGTDERMIRTSSFHDYFIILLLIAEAGLGLYSVLTTATSTVENYSALGIWAQKIITFQPDTGAVIAGHSIVYKIHIFIGLLIFMIFPYTKLMHMLVFPLVYFFRRGYQLVRR